MFGSEYTLDEIIYYEKKQSYEEGLGEGLKQGKSEGIKEVVMEMLKNGMDVDQVAKISDFPENIIRNWQAELQLKKSI